MYSLFTILGVSENAPQTGINSAYEYLRKQLEPSNFAAASLANIQAQQCLLSIENAYRTLCNPTGRQNYEEERRRQVIESAPGMVQPKLGQLCVAAGIITLEELERAVESQTNLDDIPIGQILQEKQLISQSELDGLLLGQQLITIPRDLPHSIGQRLMALGLVTEDMVRIALIIQRTFDKNIEAILVEHGWLDAKILDILLAQCATAGKA